jgi:hypothetical protein
LKLVHVLLAKSLAETILVGSLSIIFFMTVFPPYFHGWGEATPVGIAGWAVNSSSPWERVEVQLFIDGNLVANGVANLSRPDVQAAGWSKDEWHGYNFQVAPLTPGIHEARVYALHSTAGEARKTLQLLGDPIRFSVDRNGVFKDLKQRSDGRQSNR